MIEQKLPKSLSCLLSQDKQTGLWINYCLDFDLVTSGKSEDEVWNSMKAMLKAHVESCFADGFSEGLSHQAKIEAWVAFAQQFLLGSFRQETIKFDLKRNDSTLSGLWLKGVEVESLPNRFQTAA